MAKLVLNIEEDFDFDFGLIGISCHDKDFRLCFELNSLFEIDFVRGDDIEKSTKNGVGIFSFFEYYDDENQLDYYIISNKSEKGLLVPEQKVVDFFLVLKGAYSDSIVEEISSKINTSPIVLTTFVININNLKSKKNLIF